MTTLTSLKKFITNKEMAKWTILHAGSCLLIFFAVLCTFGAIISGFSLTVNVGRLSLVWLASSITMSLVMFYRGKGILVLLVPSLILFIWNFTEIADGFKWVVYIITESYEEWTPLTVVFSDMQDYGKEPYHFFAAVGIALTLLLSTVVYLRQSTSYIVLSTLPFVSLTFIVIDTGASSFYLLGLIAVYLTSLLSSAISDEDFKKKSLVYIPSFLLSTIFLGVVYLALPSSDYERGYNIELLRYHARTISTRIGRELSLFSNEAAYPGVGWPNLFDSGVWSFNMDSVNVAEAGERVISDTNLLEINVSEPGTFYLRGYSMDLFDGKSWRLFSPEYSFESIDSFERTLAQMPSTIANLYTLRYIMDFDEQLQEASLITKPPPIVGMNLKKIEDVTLIDYIPYYAGNNLAMAGGLTEISNYDKQFYYMQSNILTYAMELEEHESSQETMTQNNMQNADSFKERLSSTESVYLEIDAYTKESLRELAILEGIDPGAERSLIVDAVAAFIRSSATYTLSPGIIPEDENFALYFLQTSKEGYCIHFATAATLMLRALDIPARFTIGYVSTVSQNNVNSHVVLTDANAHSWVEVLYPDAGWVYLEATPSSTESVIPSALPHTPTRQTITEPTAPQPLPRAEEIPETISQNAGRGAESARALPEWAVSYIVFGASAVLLAIAVILRRHISNLLRKRRFEQRDTNVAVIYMWRYIEKVSRHEAAAPKEIVDLALKARFSRHRITEEESAYMRTFVIRLAKEIYLNKDDESRFWFKYVRALI